MVGDVRTVALPVNAGADWLLSFPDRTMGDKLHYRIDASAWLLDGNETVQGVSVSASPGLTLGPLSYVLTNNVITGWSVMASGGVPGQGAVIEFDVSLVNQDALVVSVGLLTRLAVNAGLVPGGVSAAAVVGGVTIAGGQITTSGQTITVGASTVYRGIIGVAGQPISVGGQSITIGVYA